MTVMEGVCGREGGAKRDCVHVLAGRRGCVADSRVVQAAQGQWPVAVRDPSITHATPVSPIAPITFSRRCCKPTPDPIPTYRQAPPPHPTRQHTHTPHPQRAEAAWRPHAAGGRRRQRPPEPGAPGGVHVRHGGVPGGRGVGGSEGTNWLQQYMHLYDMVGEGCCARQGLGFGL